MEARKWTLGRRFEGMPKFEDFELVTEALQDLQDGEILAKAEWWTVDPYMRTIANDMKLGEMMGGGQVAAVIKSKNSDFPEGTKIVGQFGWRDLTIYKPGPAAAQGPRTVYKLPDLKGLPESYCLGILGMPGNTAYFGLTRVIRPNAGETLVVSAAAGAVGSIVGQVGKILGLKVLGFAGTQDKINWLKNDLGFDEAFNYKTVNLDQTFKQYASEGIDCYFDNVGGEFTYYVTQNMNQGGRIALCGAITTYNTSPADVLVPMDYKALIYKNIRMEGMLVMRWEKEWMDGIIQLRDWILEGKLKAQETISNGFETMPQAFIDMLQGKNTGKQVIKA